MTATSVDGSPPGLWSSSVRRVTLIGNGLGVVLGAVGLFGAAAQESVDAQILWVNVGIVGSIVAGCAQATWLIEGRRSVSLLRRRAVAPLVERWAPLPEPAEHASVQESVVVAGMATVHRPNCILVRAKATTPAPEGAPLAPCRVCGG